MLNLFFGLCVNCTMACTSLTLALSVCLEHNVVATSMRWTNFTDLCHATMPVGLSEKVYMYIVSQARLVSRPGKKIEQWECAVNCAIMNMEEDIVVLK